MERQNNVLWNLTFVFFIFFSIFIAFKFLFIFFFRAAFEPDFIFELTPLFLLLGMNNLQLLFLSLIIVVSDTYLHMRPTRKNILYSFIPTLIMVSGLGLGITTKEISADYLPNYLLFGFLLFVVLIDQRRTLTHPETLATERPTKIEPSPQPSKFKFALPKIRLSLRGRPKPEGVPVAKTTSEGVPIVKPKPYIAIASSLFSLFKRKKRTSEPETGKEVKEEPKPISFESVEKELPVVEGQVKETSSVPSEKFTPTETVTEEEPTEEYKPVPSSEDKEKSGGGVHFGGTPSGGSGGVPQFNGKENVDSFKTDAYKFSPVSSYKGDEMGVGKELKLPEEAKGFTKISDDSKVSFIEQQVEELDKKSLGEFEQMFGKDKREFEDTKYLEKKKIGVPVGTLKQIILIEDLNKLREKIANRKNEIKSETNVIQDVKSDFKKIEGGLDLLKNRLVNLGEEIQSTVQDMVISDRRQEERSLHERYVEEREPSLYSDDSRRSIEQEIVEPAIEHREWVAEERSKSDIIKAQVILEDLEKRVEKLERIYFY